MKDRVSPRFASHRSLGHAALSSARSLSHALPLLSKQLKDIAGPTDTHLLSSAHFPLQQLLKPFVIIDIIHTQVLAGKERNANLP